jgi:hypothetical protein
MTVQRFDLPYSGAAVEDLRQRLARTRWPDHLPGSRWDYGVSLDYLKELCQYWKDQFDWKRQIEKMSAFHHYRYSSPTAQGRSGSKRHRSRCGTARVPRISAPEGASRISRPDRPANSAAIRDPSPATTERRARYQANACFECASSDLRGPAQRPLLGRALYAIRRNLFLETRCPIA